MIEKGAKIWKIPRQWARIEGNNVRDTAAPLSQEVSSSPSRNNSSVAGKTSDRLKSDCATSPNVSDDCPLSTAAKSELSGLDHPPLTSSPGKKYGIRSRNITMASEMSQWWIPSGIFNYQDVAEAWDVSGDLFVQEDRTTGLNDAEEEVDLHGFDLSRLPHRIYISIPSARRAIRSKVFGLLRAPNSAALLWE